MSKYPALSEYNAEILDDLLDGMRKCLAKNPDPAFSIHKLIGRAVTDLIVLSDDTKTHAIICEILVDDFGKKYVFVWGAYSTIGFDADKAMKTLEWVATETGSTYIESLSHRMGWGRQAKEYDIEVLPAKTYRKYL